MKNKYTYTCKSYLLSHASYFRMSADYTARSRERRERERA